MKKQSNTQQQEKTPKQGIKNAVFGQDGMLHKAIGEEYELRDGQMRMATAVVRAILGRNILLCEGATGIGKSFGYLIPAFSPYARKIRETIEESPKPIIVSTSTKMLQDQLIEVDVPLVSKATGEPLKIHVAKGRGNYLSKRRLDNFLTQLEENTFGFDTADTAEQAAPQANALNKWWTGIQEKSLEIDGEFTNFTPTQFERAIGNKTEYIERIFELHPEIVEAVRSDHQDCLGQQCENYPDNCPFYKKRKQMDEANLIIVNHHLLLMHFRYGNILPDAYTYIIDEAHKFYQTASSVFEITVNLARIRKFLTAFMTKWKMFLLESQATDNAQIQNVINTLEKKIPITTRIAEKFFNNYYKQIHQDALECNVISPHNERYSYATINFPNHKERLMGDLQGYIEICDTFANECFSDLVEDEDIHQDIIKSRAQDYHKFLIINNYATDLVTDTAEVLSFTSPKTYCYWADVANCKKNDDTINGSRLTLKRTPINIEGLLQPLFAKENAVIFTSATLTSGQHNFNRIRTQLGLQNNQRVKEIAEPSPFPSENLDIHMFSYIIEPPPHNAPIEKQEKYWKQQTNLCEYYLKLNQGRALVLCRSRQQMDMLYQRLIPTLESIGVNHFKQDEHKNIKKQLAAFIEDETSVMFGVETCWEGIDAKGDTLKTLIITKLPFAPPHPVTEARIKQLPNPKQGFFDIILPEMLLRLKQGAGRLIRSATDTGTIAILDSRARTKKYNRYIKQVLPLGNVIINPKAPIEQIESIIE